MGEERAQNESVQRDTKWQRELRDMGNTRAEHDLLGWKYHGHKPWSQFRQGMLAYVSELRDFFPSMEEEIVELFSKMHSRGVRVRAWDICGMADAKEIGAEETDCLTRVLPDNHPLRENPACILGNRTFERDIFTKEALDPLIERAKERGAPVFITMIPVGGLSMSGQREHPFGKRMLAYQLHRALKILAPNGHIYFQNPYWGQPGDKKKDFKMLKSLISRYGVLEPDEPNVRFYRIIKFDQAS